MLKVNSEIEIAKIHAGTSKKGTAFWNVGVPIYSYDNGIKQHNGFVTVYCNGSPIAGEGEKVYIHEITGFDLKRKRNKQGAWSQYPRLYCVCGTEPLGGATDFDEETY